MSRLQAAGVVARVAKIAEVRLIKLACEMQVAVDEVLDRECAILTHVDAHRYSYDEASARLAVEVTGRVALHESGQPPPPDGANKVGRQLLLVTATFGLSYELPKEAPPVEMRETLFGAFAFINGTYNAWPYLRELVQSVTTRMGLPGLLIPLYRVPESDEALGEEPHAPRLKLVAGGGK